MPRVIVFDDGKGELAPLTGLRAAFEVRTGALTTLERITRGLGAPGALIVPEPLAPLARERHGLPVNEAPAGRDQTLLLNGRAPLACEVARTLAPGTAAIDGAGELIAAYVAGERAAAVLVGDRAGLRTATVEGLGLMTRPWHVRLLRDRCITLDLALLGAGAGASAPPAGVTVFGTHALWVAPDARVLPGAAIDLEHGPVVIDRGGTVRPGAVVIGPAYVGPSSTVMDRAVIRAFTAIGPHCKVGGEVGGTIFQGFANKAHDGYLGDSWVGEWVNLGAGTVNSNLLNTYAEVRCRATPGGPEEPAGERFVGAFIGDHAKTAIGTRIMTGAVIGTGAMLAASAPASGCIPPFAWRTDAADSAWAFDKFESTARAMMARRNLEPSGAYLARLRALHAAGMARP